MAFLDVLRRNMVTLAWGDHPWTYRPFDSQVISLDLVTAPTLYVRWLGDRRLIERDFSHERESRDRDLRYWAEVISERVRRTVMRRAFGFMNNHYTGHSPAALRRFISLWEATNR